MKSNVFFAILDLLHGPTNFHQKVLAEALLDMPQKGKPGFRFPHVNEVHFYFCADSGPPTWSDQLSSKGLGRSSARYAPKGQTRFSLPPCKWSPFLFLCRFWTSYMVRPTFIKRSWPMLRSICPNKGNTSFRFPHVNEVQGFFSFFFYQSGQWKKWKIVHWLHFSDPTTRSCLFRVWPVFASPM